jgi:hypothetical protein
MKITENDKINKRELEQKENSNLINRLKSALYTILNNNKDAVRSIKEIYRQLNLKNLEN